MIKAFCEFVYALATRYGKNLPKHYHLGHLDECLSSNVPRQQQRRQQQSPPPPPSSTSREGGGQVSLKLLVVFDNKVVAGALDCEFE